MAELRTIHLLTAKLAVSGMQPIGATPTGNRRIGPVVGDMYKGARLRGTGSRRPKDPVYEDFRVL